MRLLSRSTTAALLLFAAACSDRTTPVTPPTDGDPGTKTPTPVGVYTIEFTGIGTDNMTSRASQAALVPNGPRLSMTNAGAGITLEQVSSASFVEGSRTGGGQRFVAFTYRIRNNTGAPLNNVTMLLVQRAVSIPGTAISVIRRFDGTNADTSIAKYVVPTGAAALGSDFVTMQALYPDVLQAFTEAEVAAITKPADVTDIFPVGYIIRSKNSNANRSLPVPTDPNQWDGLLTVSFRLPLQPTPQQDVFSFTIQLLGVTDTETRLTESIEESQDTAAVRRLRDRATALGATTVTVLNGSPVMDPAVPDYPGQRQICNVRASGPAGSPVSGLNAPGAYSSILILRQNETYDSCATNVAFPFTILALDRYGNIKTSVADTVRLSSSGPPSAFSPAAALTSGIVGMSGTFSDYGTATVTATGRRLTGTLPLTVAGVVRTWTANAHTTDWHTASNWSPAAVPMSLDSVYIPAAPVGGAFFPVIAANVQIGGVQVENNATLTLNAFDLTASANVTAGLTGGIVNTSGRLFLSGIAKTVEGKVPPLRVTGTYSLTNNVNARAPIQVDAGRLTVSAVRLQADSN